MGSETTAAQQSAAGVLRFDPMAMLPFCGYNMADYFGHWLEMGAKGDESKLPKIFFVNWFRRDDNGRFLWPGYGENSRVLKWVFERLDGTADAVETPIGFLPAPGSLDVTGLDVSEADMAELLSVDADGWRSALPQFETHFAQFGDRLPGELTNQLQHLAAAL
jgi:phosphoenolpyruvate carboxykinase (GTP)